MSGPFYFAAEISGCLRGGYAGEGVGQGLPYNAASLECDSALVLIHTHVRLDAERLQIPGIIREKSDANAGSYLYRVVIQAQWLFEHFQKRTADKRRLFMICRRLKDDGKFIASRAGYSVRMANSSLEKLGDPLQEHVPGVVAIGVVDEFEFVEIDREQSRLRTGAAGALKRSCKAVLKKTAVGKASQFVMQRPVLVVLNM